MSSQVDVLTMGCRDVEVPPPSGSLWGLGTVKLLIPTDGVFAFIAMTEIPGNDGIRIHFGIFSSATC